MPNLTLMDWARRVDPDGTVPLIADLLSQTNEILTDMVMMQGNLPTGHRCTIQTGLPTVYYRALNQGIGTSKGNTVQVDEGCAMAEAWSEVDVDLAMLNGNTAEFRLSEARMFLEAMNQTIANGLFYGNPAAVPTQFLGLQHRYSDQAAGNAQNIIDGLGNTAFMQTSVWLVCWGDNTTFTIFPKGSTAGLLQEDLGKSTSYDTGSGTGTRMRVWTEHFQWKIGLVVKDWRSVVRICNLDTTDFFDLSEEQAPSGFEHLIHLMVKAMARIPKGIYSQSRPVFYMNRSAQTLLERLALEKSNQAVTVTTATDQFGRAVNEMRFRGIPIRQCDAILNTEDVVPAAP